MQYTSPEVYEYISKQTGDPIVEWKICAVSGTKFPITQKDVEFYDKISPTFNGKRYQIPMPTLCPEERQRRRMARRNERKLYRRICDATNKSIISMYHASHSFKVYDTDAWRGDGYKQPTTIYNSSIPINDHFIRTYSSSIRRSRILPNSENSDYCNFGAGNKDCYLCFGADRNEGCLYCSGTYDSKGCLDCEYTYSSELCYGTFCVARCYQCFHSSYLADCYQCYGCYKCRGCKRCINCHDLENKEFCIDDIQYDKTSFFKKLEEKGLDENLLHFTRPGYLKQWNAEHSENCFGNDYLHSKNCKSLYDCDTCEDCSYVTDCVNMIQCEDFNVSGGGLERCYEGTSCINGQNLLFCVMCVDSSYMVYCENCFGCLDCFGCVGLRSAQYCIFNTQYTKQEYETLVPKIIEQMQEEGTWGEFFDPSLSPFGYNETVAHEYYPMTKQEALDRGYNRSEYENETKIPNGVSVLKAGEHTQEIRERLKDDDTILNQIIICEVSGKPFRIIKQELEFYRKHNLPIPTKHPDVRHQERLAKRPGRMLYLRKCDKTGEEMVSVCPPEYEGKVYSEEAYREEVYN